MTQREGWRSKGAKRSAIVVVVGGHHGSFQARERERGNHVEVGEVT